MSDSIRAFRPLIVLGGCVLVVGTLYLARVVLIPVAMAIFLSFLLYPIVSGLRRIGLPRSLSVCVVAILGICAFGATGWILTAQAKSLIAGLPGYKDNIREKISDLRWLSKTPLTVALQDTIDDITGELKKDSPLGATKPEPEPVPVEVKAEGSSLLRQMAALLEPLASTGLVIVLVIFMLLQWEELRDRLIRVIGYRRLTVTTKALDDAGRRISRYLLMQCVVNGSYGVCVGAGLYALGVEYAPLWGSLAAVLRFIPYVGPLIAAVLPTALAVAAFPGWMTPLLVVSLFGILELATNFVLEPMLYGTSTEISEVALLVSIAFWTALWGPLGFVLATPLTVGLAVLGKYVPSLEFLSILMRSAPAMAVGISFYQRILARDPDGALRVIDESLQAGQPEDVYDTFLVAALGQSKRDRSRDDITDDDVQFTQRSVGDIVDVLAVRSPVTPVPDKASSLTGELAEAHEPKPLVLGCPASGVADVLALEMLADLLQDSNCRTEVIEEGGAHFDVVGSLREKRPAIVCVGAMRPGGLARARYFCKRLRSEFPDSKIVVGRWGVTPDREEDTPALQLVGADLVATSLIQAKAFIDDLVRPERDPDDEEAAAAAE